MKIKVDYEECNTCGEAEDCELLKAMQKLVDCTVEVLRDMSPKERLDGKSNEVQS